MSCVTVNIIICISTMQNPDLNEALSLEKSIMDRKDQRVCIKFCVKNEKTESEIYDMLQKAYGKASLSRYIVYEWVRCFKKDRDLMKEDLWSGKQSASTSDANVEKLRLKIQEDRRLTARELAEEVGIPNDTCQAIITVNLGLKRIASKLVPRFLSDDERNRRFEICSELKKRVETDSQFMETIITGEFFSLSVWLTFF